MLHAIEHPKKFTENMVDKQNKYIVGGARWGGNEEDATDMLNTLKDSADDSIKKVNIEKYKNAEFSFPRAKKFYQFVNFSNWQYMNFMQVAGTGSSGVSRRYFESDYAKGSRIQGVHNREAKDAQDRAVNAADTPSTRAAVLGRDNRRSNLGSDGMTPRMRAMAAAGKYTPPAKNVRSFSFMPQLRRGLGILYNFSKKNTYKRPFYHI